ncbi:MAG TPA: tRNA1(Val) (adenine(37)-N6)-methyltransferase [Syntrophales bacterium]|nr:tRNA1(Val) (adenine(37)-N6)-methyltransferase [Syntrophales bacterium]
MKKTGTDVSALRREGETVDELLGGRIRIFQKKKGYRFSVDALLLAHFISLKKGDAIIDLGTGSGVIAIILAQRKECGKVVGVDIQEELVDMAKRSVQLNKLHEKVVICRGDVRNIETLVASKSFNVAVFNPPYRKLKSGRINPSDQKSIARHEIRATLRDFLKAAEYVLKKSGRTYIIYPAARMVELLSSMRISGIEPKRMRIVHSHDASRGEFILVEGIKSGREELEVMPPLFIYSEGSKYTEAMTRIFREVSLSPKNAAG